MYMPTPTSIIYIAALTFISPVYQTVMRDAVAAEQTNIRNPVYSNGNSGSLSSD